MARKIDIEWSSILHPESGRLMLRIENRVFMVVPQDQKGIQEILPTLRYDSKRNILVVDRKRDFGGCGKDAYKLECGVPMIGWFQEYMIEPAKCEFCGVPATTFDLAPTCNECTVRA